VDCTVNNTHGTSSTIAIGTNTERASGTCAPSILFRGTASKSFFTRVRFSRFRRCASREEEEEEDEVEVEAPLNDVVVECQKHLFPGSAGGDGPSQRARAKEEETEVEVAAAAAAEEEAKEKKPRRRIDEATLRMFFIGVKRMKKK
jgi:hypothetical protein